MKSAGKSAAPMGRSGTPKMVKKVKIGKYALSDKPACGHKSGKAGPDKGM